MGFGIYSTMHKLRHASKHDENSSQPPITAVLRNVKRKDDDQMALKRPRAVLGEISNIPPAHQNGKCVAAVSVSAAVPVAVPQRKKRKTPVRVTAGGMAVDTPAATLTSKDDMQLSNPRKRFDFDHRLHTDIDAAHDHDPLFVPEYAHPITVYLQSLETRQRAKAHYMQKQKEITPEMRAVLHDWMVEVCEEYRLKPETLFLAVNYVDRFLSYMHVTRGKLQLVGVTAMFIAGKFEEIYPPTVGDYEYISDHTYTKQQILMMETMMLKTLNWEMGAPTPRVFADRFLRAADADEQLSCLTYYLIELTIVDIAFLKYMASTIAAAAVSMALHTLGREPWSSTLSHYTQMDPWHIELCLHDLHKLYQRASTLPQTAVRDKYRADKHMAVANISAPESYPFGDEELSPPSSQASSNGSP